jgi:ATP-dependent protease ClpP protease subunit
MGRPQIDVHSYISQRTFSRWDSSLRSAAEQDSDARTIGIYDVIGEDWWTGGGYTSKMLAAALRSMGKGPVTVNINSPGGDMFEGLAMYSQLREFDGDVTIKILGLAASAASVVSMGGDTIQIARSGFLMIHNCWTVGVGNRHDFAALAQQMEPFDQAMADIYAARTGGDLADMQKLMDAESWIGGSAAVDQSFADALLASDQVTKGNEGKSASAVRRLEAALRASGMPKSEAMRLISQFKTSLGDPAGDGAGDPTDNGSRDAADFSETAALAASLTNIFPRK